jgi:hypothetical protein
MAGCALAWNPDERALRIPQPLGLRILAPVDRLTFEIEIDVLIFFRTPSHSSTTKMRSLRAFHWE